MPRVRSGHAGLALAVLCWFLTSGLWAAQANERLNTLRGAAFETAGPDSPHSYLWRDRGLEAGLNPGGKITVRLPSGHQFRIAFPGANPGVEPRGESPASYRVFYYAGSSRHWRSSARWERVRYRDIYPGVDLVLLAAGGELEYNFEIRPGANPASIRIRYFGTAVRLNAQGDIEIRSHGEMIRQRLPAAFQGQGAKQRAVPCRYRLERGLITLRLEHYDSRQMLVIDPVLNFSTYLGGTSFDAIYATAVDLSGNLYVAGETSSGSLPKGALTARASRDAWVAKINNAGTQILYLVYLGGSGNDAARAIAVDSSGNAYVTGATASTDFPTTTGALSTHNSGVQEAFVAKLNSMGQLNYSTYLGGSSSDTGFAIAVDATGAAFVAGQTGSAVFPVTSGVFQPSIHGGLSDCFVSKLNTTGSALAYSTYLGGGALDLCAGIALDASGNAYVTGTTYSTDFPTHTPLQNNLMGSASAFVTKLNPAGSALLYSTYLGGSVLENGTAIAVDSAGAAYVAGCTASPDFPTTAGVLQTALKGTLNAFVSKLSSSAGSLVYSTLIGGSASDAATAIAIDSLGQAVIGGYTSSANFPVANAIQSTFQGSIDAFAAVVSVDGTGLSFSSFFGGSADDRAYAVETLPVSRLFLAGMTSSVNFPTAIAMQSSTTGAYDAFAMSASYVPGQDFIALKPCRIADTRAIAGNGLTGAFGPPFLGAGSTRSFPIPASGCSVPSTGQAYSLNITVIPHGALGFLTAWPGGSSAPMVASVNALNGAVTANAAIVPAGPSGSISLYASDDTDVVIDINGYFGAPATPQALAFYPVTPCRVADTRAGRGFNGAFGPPSLVAGATRAFPVQQSSCGIPVTAQAYSARMTAIAPGPLGFLTTWPAGQTRPNVATLNALSGGVIGNEALVSAGVGGAISVYASDNTDLVIDVNGYLGPPGSPGGLNFYPLAPCRIADTRSGKGFSGAFGTPSLVAGATRDFPIPSSLCGLPSSAQAYSLNMTAVATNSLGFLTAWPVGVPRPLAATLNALSGGVVGSAAIVPAGTAGAISVYASDSTDLVIDVNGYFAP